MKEFANKKTTCYDSTIVEGTRVISTLFLEIFTYYIQSLLMPRQKQPKSETLNSLFGTVNDGEVSKKLIQKLMQYNMKYEEITHVVLSHSERAFLDARLITLEEYYRELQATKKSEVENFLASIPDFELSRT